MKVFYGILGAFGATGAFFSLLVTWITMAPTSDEFFDRNMRISKALDETRIKALEMDRDLKLEELDAARLLEIEREALRDSIVSDFKIKMGSRTRAQNETRIKNMKDRRQKLTVAGLGLLASLLITAYAIWGLRAEKRAEL